MQKIALYLSIILLLVACAPAANTVPTLASVSTGTLLPATVATVPATEATLPAATATPRPRVRAGDELGFLKGMNYVSWNPTNYGHPLSDLSLEALADTGTNWVSLNVSGVQENRSSTIIDEHFHEDAGILHATQKAHDLNMNVMMKMHVVFESDPNAWGGSLGEGFGPTKWDAWFTSYTQFILYYAKMAEENNVEMLCIGTELRLAQMQTEHFKELIKEVRKVFSGPITYGADGERPEAIEWWDQVDYIGIDAYYTITKKSSPSLDELEIGWQPLVTRLEALSNKWNRPIIFAEVGFNAQEYSACNGGCGRNMERAELGRLDPQTQANAYQALFNVFRDKEWFQGTFWWGWDDNVYSGGMCDPQYTPKGKLAENVLRIEYGAAPAILTGPAPLPIFDENNIVEFPIFRDSFEVVTSGGWGSIKFADVSSPVYEGAKAFRMDINDGSGFSAVLDLLDTTPYQWLEFYIYSETNIEDSFRVWVGDENWLEYYFNGLAHCNYLDNQSSIKTGQWNRILIPLEEIVADKRLLQSVSWTNQSPDSVTVWVDEVRFVGLGTGTPNELSHDQPQPQPTIISTENDLAPMTGEDGATLVYVPAGKFTMGSDSYADTSNDEKPAHQVDLSAFWIDQTEVTNKQYAACVSGGKCTLPSNTSSDTRSSYYGNPQFDNYPVIYVDWNQANTYCSWAGRRLPTEAEWEKAARGIDARIYTWGNGIPDETLLNYNRNIGDTTEVKNYPEAISYYGAYDMLGNVWEWVNDWYSKAYYQNSPASNPLGPVSGEYRALRGGSWYYQDGFVRTALRGRFYPSDADSDGGFRCALSALQSTELSPNSNGADGTSHQYDNFDDPKYDGSFNNALWSVDIPSNTTRAIQQDGILMLADKDETVGQGIILSLSKWHKPIFGFLEAKIKVQYESGSNGNLTLSVVSPALRRGWTEMGITPASSGGIFRVLGFVEMKVENDTWYVMRMEYDHEKNVLNYFLDGEQVATYVVPNKVESLTPGIQLWHPDGGSVTGYIDYVAIGD